MVIARGAYFRKTSWVACVSASFLLALVKEMNTIIGEINKSINITMLRFNIVVIAGQVEQATFLIM